MNQKYIDGHWYYFQNDGTAATGFKKIDTRTVYYNAAHQMIYGLQNIGGNLYYFDTRYGTRASSEEKYINGYWYYFQEDGTAATGLKWIKYKNCLYDSNGHMLYGMQRYGDDIYFLNKVTGALEVSGNGSSKDKSELFANNHWYLLKKDGGYYTGIQYVPAGNKICFYNGNGEMQYGEQKLGSDWYWFDTRTGALSYDQLHWNNRGLSYYGGDGAAVKNTSFSRNGSTFYVGGNGLVYSTNTPMGYYNQTDLAWAYYRVGFGTIGGTGCEPTNAAVIANHFGIGGDPVTFANLFHSWGNYNTWVAGTDNAVWAKFANYCGLRYQNNLSYQDILNKLREGWVVTTCVGAGNFVSGGATHSLILAGLDANGRTYVGDPLTQSHNGWYYPSLIWNQQSHAREDVMDGGPFVALGK